MPEGPDGTAAPPAPPVVQDDAPTGDLGITVALDQFSGPMDLLLYLVRRAEVEVKDLPIAAIADQFATWVAAAAGTVLDLEAAGDFVVMAATLLEIKARQVAPPPEGTVVQDDGEDVFDPRAGLIRKLLVYRAAKEAAFDLDRRDDDRRLRHERGHREIVPDDPAEVDAWEMKDVGVGNLANLWFDLLKRIDGMGPRTVLVDDVPMGVRMAQVVEGMRVRGEGRLSELFALDSGPIARVGIVMAVLECTRQRMLRIRQGEQYGEVHIGFRPEDDRAVAQGDPGPPEQLPKRQRRPPLVTWSGAPAAADEDGDEAREDDTPTVENEEQRFLRELETTIGVERLLARASNLELSFIDWWEETHPGEALPPGVVRPEPPPPPPPPPEPKAEEPERPKRQPPKPKVAQAVVAEEQKPAGQAAGQPRSNSDEPPAAPMPPVAEAAATVPDPQAVTGTMPAWPETGVLSQLPPLPTPGSGVADPGLPPVVVASTPSPLPDLRGATPSFIVVPLPCAEPDPVPGAGVQIPQPDPEPLDPVMAAESAEMQADVADAPSAAEDVTAVAPVQPVEPDQAAQALPESAVLEPAAEHVEATAGTEQPPVEDDATLSAVEPEPASAPEPEPAIAAASVVELPQAEAEVVAAPVTPSIAEPQPAAAVEPEPAERVEVVAAPLIEPEPVVLDESAAPTVSAAEAPADMAPEPEPMAEPEPEPEPVAVAGAESSPESVAIPEPVAVVSLPPEPVAMPEPLAVAEPPPEPVAEPPGPPPDPSPTANTPPTPAPTTQHTKATPMSRSRNLKLAALATLWVACTVGLVAWAYAPVGVLEVSGPQADAVVARDAEVVWVLNLPLDEQQRAQAALPSIEPAVPGSFAWRDVRTCVFTPVGALPPAARFTVRFSEELRSKGGFRFDPEALPSSTLTTLPVVQATTVAAQLPAFGDGTIDIGLTRVPNDSAALLAAVAISPAVPVHKAIVDGHLRLSGPFAPKTSYRITIADTVSGRPDDLPMAWQQDIDVPARTPGARLLAGVGRQARIEAVGLDLLVVEAAEGRRDVVRFDPVTGDVPAVADLPLWLLSAGENRLQLRWEGGATDVVLNRHDLRLTPEDGAPALLGGTLPVTAAR
jgi:segregation and condensation protein A